MFGCHNCPNVPAKGTRFEKSPCAKCRTARDPMPHSQYDEDPAGFSSVSVMHPAYSEEEDEFIRFRNELFTALAESVGMLAMMKTQYPETYKFVEAKMRDPYVSYSELAERFSCRKQNVMYHLKKAVEMCPQLSTALLIDTRFCRGQYAFNHNHGANLQ